MIEVGLKRSDFYCLTPLEYDDEVRRYLRRRDREWERIRWLAWHIYLNNPNIKSHQKPKTPKELLSLSIDPKTEVSVEDNKKWGKAVKDKIKKWQETKKS